MQNPTPKPVSKLSGCILILLAAIIIIILVAVLSDQSSADDQSSSLASAKTAVPTEIVSTETAVPTATVVSSSTPSPIPTQTAIPTPTRIRVDLNSEVERVKEQFKLISVEAIVKVEAKYHDDNYILMTDGKYNVSAGVDFSNITKENFAITDTGEINIVTITLPATSFIAVEQVESHISDKVALSVPEQWKQFWYGESVSLPLAEQITQDQKIEAKRRACEFGLLNFAADNARYNIREFLMDSNPSDQIKYVVISSAGECTK